MKSSKRENPGMVDRRTVCPGGFNSDKFFSTLESAFQIMEYVQEAQRAYEEATSEQGALRQLYKVTTMTDRYVHLC
jgi:hypothetical protein